MRPGERIGTIDGRPVYGFTARMMWNLGWLSFAAGLAIGWLVL